MAPKRRPKDKKEKTKTFTGCWTCRVRKLKCDTLRPGCRRCRKAGLECGGYNIKLYWVTECDTVPPSAIKRQTMSLEDYPRWSFQLDEIDRHLSRIDCCDLQSIDTIAFSAGPFSIFSARSDDSLDYLTYSEEHLTVASLSDQRAWSYKQSPAIPFEVSAMMFQDPISASLMDHYVRNISTLLQPIPHPQNTYRSTYVPGAMIGSATLLSGLCGSSMKIPPSLIAMFYSLIATSAFHLRGSDITGKYNVLGRILRGRAFWYLKMALQESPVFSRSAIELTHDAAASLYEAHMSAMLTLVTLDVMEGSMGEYWVHLDGVNQIQRHLNHDTRSSPINERLFTVSSFLTILSKTTSINLPSLPWSTAAEVAVLRNKFECDSQILETTYGITSRLANSMDQITKMSQHISHFVSNSDTVPQSLLSACSRICASLHNWTVDTEPLKSLSSLPESHTTVFIAKTHIQAFSASLCIYYHTRILPCSASEMFQYVNQVAELLTSIEATKAATSGYSFQATASITWPGFIASCEADVNQRSIWMDWWKCMLRYQIGNIARLWQIVQEAWELRDEGSVEVPAWLPVLRMRGRGVLAI